MTSLLKHKVLTASWVLIHTRPRRERTQYKVTVIFVWRTMLRYGANECDRRAGAKHFHAKKVRIVSEEFVPEKAKICASVLEIAQRTMSHSL